MDPKTEIGAPLSMTELVEIIFCVVRMLLKTVITGEYVYDSCA